MKKLFSYLVVAMSIALFSFTGCVNKSDLDPAGVYKSDAILYTADKAITTSYQTFDTFLKWEFDNRTVLSKWPEIKQAADFIRTYAPGWTATAINARDAYKAIPNEGNRQALEKSLAVLRAALDQAAAYYARREQIKTQP